MLLVLLNEDKVILEVGVVKSPEMRKLVHIWVNIEIIIVILIQTKASYDLLSHEIHNQNIRILASDCN